MLLDIYCGAGGATRGFQMAGFTVTGVDSKYQKHYVGENFIKKNVFDLDINWIRSNFCMVFASPPCQHYVTMSDRNNHPDLVGKTREFLKEIGLPWVMENVPTAPMLKWVFLCGLMFPQLRVIRHRKFEFSHSLIIRQPEHYEHPPVYSFDRRERRLQGLNEDENYVTVAGNNASLGAMSDAMGIGWMTRPEIAQALPPLYTKYIGEQIKVCLQKAA